MATISVADVLGVTTLEVGTIAGIITDNKAAVLAALGQDENTNVASMALLPNDDAVAAAGDEVRYLTSRPAALVDVLLDHFSTSNLIADASVSTTMGDGDFISVAGDTWTVASGVLTFDAKTLSTVAAEGLNSNAGSVGVYSEASDFLLQASRTDTDNLANVAVTIGQVLSGEAGTNATSYGDKFATVKSLILAHGVDIFKATEEIDGHWLTVFLPNEVAFDAVEGGNAGRKNLLTWCKDLTQAVLKNHVLNSTTGIYSEDVIDPASTVSLATGPDNQGPTVTFGTSSLDGDLNVDFVFENSDNDVTAKILAAAGAVNLYTSNAISHEIDTVLALDAELALVDDAIGRVNLTDTVHVNSTLLDLVAIADALILLAINGGADGSEKTLLIPSEDAFAALTTDQLAYLQSDDGSDDLNMILKAHLFDKPYFTSTAAPAGMTDANSETPSCVGSVCSSANLSNVTYSKFGLSYIIDAVIVPSGAKLAPATPTETETDSDSDSNSAASTTAVSAFAAAVCAFGLSFLF